MIKLEVRKTLILQKVIYLVINLSRLVSFKKKAKKGGRKPQEPRPRSLTEKISKKVVKNSKTKKEPEQTKPSSKIYQVFVLILTLEKRKNRPIDNEEELKNDESTLPKVQDGVRTRNQEKFIRLTAQEE